MKYNSTMCTHRKYPHTISGRCVVAIVIAGILIGCPGKSSAVAELQTSKATMVGTLAYQAITMTRPGSGTETVSPTSGGISTTGVRYTIEKKTGDHTGVSIDETTGAVSVPKNLALGVSKYEITVTKQDYQSQTAVLTVTITMDLGEPLASITHKTLADTRTYKFTVTWDNGVIQGKKEGGILLVANEISYEIHYAWEKKTEADRRGGTAVTIADIQSMKTHKKHEITTRDPPLPTTATVKEYMGADQRVYVYVEAINSIATTKHTVSAVQHYDTAIAYTQIATRSRHTVGLKRDGSLWAWGANKFGQLGDNTKGTDSTTPVQVQGVGDNGNLQRITAIAAGGYHTVALDGSENVWAWGRNNHGQLGLGDAAKGTDSTTPVQVKGVNGSGNLEEITAIAGGVYYTVALDGSGNVWAWGANKFGQLGDNTEIGHTTPVKVLGAGGSGYLKNITAIAAGVFHTVALDGAKDVWAWGRNNYGQLGDGTKTSSNTPVQVKGVDDTGYLENIIAITAGGGHMVALDGSENVWAWGRNNHGQLGNGHDGDDANSTTPVQVQGEGGTGYLENITAIAAGGRHTVALDSSGNVWAWGDNDYGQLGNGHDSDDANSTTPVQVQGEGGSGHLGNITAIAAGSKHTVALKRDGTVWIWGADDRGQRGNKSTTNSATPGIIDE